MKENEYLESISIGHPKEISNRSEIGPIRSTRLFSKDIVECLENIYDFGREEYQDILIELVNQFVSTDLINADADDFHNISVELSRRDENILAIKIIEVGLKNFPWNTDLLADYIQFGTSICTSRIQDVSVGYDKIQQEVKECYNKIMQIPQVRWTWRAFCFSIDYLVDFLSKRESPEKVDEYLNTAYELAKSFVEQYASDESYVSLSKVIKEKEGPKAELTVLEEALNSKDLRVAPKCAMRFAERLFTNGEYEKSLKTAQRGIRDSVQTQKKVSLGYLYLLSGLSKLSLIEREEDTNDTLQKTGRTSLRQKILDIYCDFNIAARELGKTSDYLEIIVSQANALKDKTSIKVPEDKYGELYSLLQANG